MIKKIFSVYDQAAETFTTPFYQNATGEAIRAFQDEANNPESAICKHAGDYTLFELGTFDTDTAEIHMTEVPKNLGLALTFKE